MARVIERHKDLVSEDGIEVFQDAQGETFVVISSTGRRTVKARSPKGRPASDAKFACPVDGCDAQTPTERGLKIHVSRVHKPDDNGAAALPGAEVVS